MSFEFDSWFENITKDEVLYSYKGSISSDLITEVLTAIEEKLRSSGERPKIIKKVYNVLVESLQNLYHHIDAPPSFENQKYQYNFAAFSFHKKNASYSIITGNFVKKEKLRLLSDRMDQINNLSPEELKTVYKIILNNNEFSEKGGGGLGMIDIARKTGHKLNYHFYDYNTDYLFFSLSIVIV
jgi:hypothetical protein